MKKHNFSAGPAILPASVLQKASEAVIDLNGIGLSILEISHRSKEFIAVLDRSVELVKSLYQVPDDYAVLFLSGGASTQFFMSAMNLLDDSGKAAYVDTGSWSSKAIKEAKQFGTVEVIASSKDKNYTYIPTGYAVPQDATYLHLTSNNTIFGTQFRTFPKTTVPIVCDMSSDVFSRQIDINQFGMIYAGAQKNMGPAGTTLVIIRKDLLGKVNRTIPSMLQYQIHIDQDSCYNTPPVYPIYVSMLTMEWIEEMGGLPVMEAQNKLKAEKMYQAIDSNPLFEGTVRPEDRSWMNATFILKDGSLESLFLKECDAAGISGLKGHRSVGGFRASIYNAMPLESIGVLTDLMDSFAQKHG
ncbi:MAG: 3-phosphoserine/phosphohydroxythreonine transaminase [Saprospiraceae bacterium]|nr:3-phosphoserine/phosphohydroxythreonine transaminase [Saprospiraceae bacterium]